MSRVNSLLCLRRDLFEARAAVTKGFDNCSCSSSSRWTDDDDLKRHDPHSLLCLNARMETAANTLHGHPTFEDFSQGQFYFSLELPLLLQRFGENWNVAV